MTGSGGRDNEHQLWGRGAYSVSEVCRILQPTMTPRKVHYWLDTGLLTDPLVRGRRGVPTLLTFRQLLEIRTVQHLRDALGFQLSEVRDAIDYVLRRLFANDWTEARFVPSTKRSGVVVYFDNVAIDIRTHQIVLPETLPGLSNDLVLVNEAWNRQSFNIPEHPHVVANARVNAGSPTLRGTRIDTAVVARFGYDGLYDQSAVAELRRTFPRVSSEALIDALHFEGLQAA